MNKTNFRITFPRSIPTASWTTFAITACFAMSAHAQSATAAMPGMDTEVLSAYQVNGVPIADQIMPTTRPISSVMGYDASIVDIPRSVTTIDQSLLSQRQVKLMTDLGQFSPGVYTPAQYGLPSTPVIRGDEGAVYFNGQRAIFSLNSVVPSFNGVEALDIVKGPGSAVFGPQSQGTGGYINFVTKQPYFDGTHTQVTATFGSWVEGGQSYFNPEFQVDTGGPITSKLAYRVSALERSGDGFYKDSKNETQDLFASLSYLFSSTIKFDWFGEFYASRYNEITGVNRVTQDFIDHGTYIAGPVQSENVFGDSVADGPYFLLLDGSKASRVKLPANIALLSPNDTARVKRFVTQLIATDSISAETTVRNLTIFETNNSHKQETYGYDEYVPKNWAIDNRTELQHTFTFGAFKDVSESGVDVRFQRLVAYADYTNEPFFLYDLSRPLSEVNYPGYSSSQVGSNFGGLPVPGQTGYAGFGLGGDASNQDSYVYQLGLFTQHNIVFTPKLSALLGLRADYIRGDSRSSDLVGAPLGSFYNSHAHVWDPSVFGSLVYKIQDKISAYATVNNVNAITGGGNFGGVDGTGGDAGLKESLKTKSLLYETGLKGAFLDNTLYTSVAAFYQKRSQPELRAPSSLIKTRGIELEAVYQPNRRFSLNANATIQHVTREGINFYEQTGNYLDGYPTDFVVDGKNGTGVGSPNFTSNPDYQKLKAAGLPSVLANVFAVYELPSGFGIGAGPQFTGPQDLNQEGTLKIPAQYTINTFIYYKQKMWDLQVSVNNVTNQRNLRAIDPNFAGNDQVFVEIPLNASMTIRYRF